ncbi:LysE family translocator [Saccharothrix longispora]|uniref:Threonine/homoserine/homoserine lactone efflux protein n=1 Tax=Saccharothrix longispora TaxID=33920 RepID=A0ABU1PWC5_9PSEU|nr:LysE family transporter [Saccharothrix longispora]MDR6594950.1 threonine/homoserine/homoserine lactone efflux protein [Saccharothrix longispora]
MDSLGLGLTLGLAASISPGPLLVLVVTSALRSGWRAGAAAACAPLLSDAVVVATTLLLLDRLPPSALGVLGVVGAVFVVWSGVRTVREARSATLGATGEPLAFRRAVLVNVLSPHPWVAWATALGPLTVTTWRASSGAAVALLVGFYLTLVGGKVVIALLVARGRRRLGDTGYRRALTCAGVLLVLAGVALGVEFAGYGR